MHTATKCTVQSLALELTNKARREGAKGCVTQLNAPTTLLKSLAHRTDHELTFVNTFSHLCRHYVYQKRQFYDEGIGIEYNHEHPPKRKIFDGCLSHFCIARAISQRLSSRHHTQIDNRHLFTYFVSFVYSWTRNRGITRQPLHKLQKAHSAVPTYILYTVKPWREITVLHSTRRARHRGRRSVSSGRRKSSRQLYERKSLSGAFFALTSLGAYSVHA